MSDCFKPLDPATNNPTDFSDGTCAPDGSISGGIPITSDWLNNLVGNLTEIITKSGVDDTDCSDVLCRAIQTLGWTQILEAVKSINAPCGTGPIPAIGPYLQLNGAGDAVVDFHINGAAVTVPDGFQVCCPDGAVWTFDGTDWVEGVVDPTPPADAYFAGSGTFDDNSSAFSSLTIPASSVDRIIIVTATNGLSLTISGGATNVSTTAIAPYTGTAFLPSGSTATVAMTTSGGSTVSYWVHAFPA